MALTRKSVELLAPAGTFKAFEAAIDAGADAVYLGGKHFNMRVHKNDFNLSDDELRAAVQYAHARGVKLDITLNNLISVEEIPPLENYLRFLDEIQPDALIVQDFAVIQLIKKLGVKIPVHASVMMNISSAAAVEVLKNFGVNRIVVSRELSLDEVKNLRDKTGVETEYFIHGDMCIAFSGQCIHSGVTFGQSGNRGRCLKPCRWAYKFLDEATGEILDETSYKLALGDMCMLRDIPALIQSGVYSFKIEGRMRPPEFIHRIVSTYRRAIDAYISDPTGYALDENLWREFYSQRVRDFTTVCAFEPPTKNDIGLSGRREPRFFSEGVVEAKFDDPAVAKNFDGEPAIKKSSAKPELTVKVSDLDAARAAVENGADAVYVGGESFRPRKPWTLAEFEAAVKFAHDAGAKIILNTPRVVKDAQLNELAELLSRGIKFDGVLVSNLGALNLARKISTLPVLADSSFNLFNEAAAEFLAGLGVVRATASLEMSFAQVRGVVEKSALPIEIIVHGATESMICQHNFVKFYHQRYDDWAAPEILDGHFALEDSAGEKHSVRVDQFGYSHIFFAKDLCLAPYVEKFAGAAALRIEAQDYPAEVTALAVKVYRAALDGADFAADFETLKKITPRAFGGGVYKFKQSRNSID